MLGHVYGSTDAHAQLQGQLGLLLHQQRGRQDGVAVLQPSQLWYVLLRPRGLIQGSGLGDSPIQAPGRASAGGNLSGLTTGPDPVIQGPSPGVVPRSIACLKSSRFPPCVARALPKWLGSRRGQKTSWVLSLATGHHWTPVRLGRDAHACAVALA